MSLASPTPSPRAVRSGVRLRRVAAGLCALALVVVPATPAAAEWQEIPRAAFDCVVLRPLSAAAVLVGAGFFAASAPLVAPAGNLRTTFDVFVYAPYEYAFERPLGDI